MTNYQIANDGTIFHIKEDGSISKLGKVENDRIVGIHNSTTTTRSSSSKGGLIFFLVVFVIATLVLGIMYSLLKRDISIHYDVSNRQISELYYKVVSLEEDLKTVRNERDAVKRELADFRDIVGRAMPFVISDIEIANTSSDGTIETAYGSIINSSQTMYLSPQIKYVGFSSGWKTISIKIFNQYGNIVTGSNSPSGYSYSTSFYVSLGENTSQLSGFGSSAKGNWQSGTYRIEIWDNNSCIKSKSFSIN